MIRLRQIGKNLSGYHELSVYAFEVSGYIQPRLNPGDWSDGEILVELDESHPLNGIIHRLRETCRNSRADIPVAVTGMGKRYPWCDSTRFLPGDGWIVFDFLNRRVSPTGYAMLPVSAPGGCRRGFSQDGLEWTEVDRYVNDNTTVPDDLHVRVIDQSVFERKGCAFWRMIRIQLICVNASDWVDLSYFDVFDPPIADCETLRQV